MAYEALQTWRKLDPKNDSHVLELLIAIQRDDKNYVDKVRDGALDLIKNL
jgi:hypothetical protein